MGGTRLRLRLLVLLLVPVLLTGCTVKFRALETRETPLRQASGVSYVEVVLADRTLPLGPFAWDEESIALVVPQGASDVVLSLTSEGSSVNPAWRGLGECRRDAGLLQITTRGFAQTSECGDLSAGPYTFRLTQAAGRADVHVLVTAYVPE